MGSLTPTRTIQAPVGQVFDTIAPIERFSETRRGAGSARLTMVMADRPRGWFARLMNGPFAG